VFAIYVCENGDIQDEKHDKFSRTGTEHLRHRFNHFDNISAKVLFPT